MGRSPSSHPGTVARVALGLLVLIGVTVLWPVQLGGSSAYVTTRGISMAPRFDTGDLAVVRSSGRYDVGDVAAYRSQLLNTVVMHRIVAIEDGRYTFKGDNNSFLDPEQPPAADLVGKLAVRVPQGGIWLERGTSPIALALIAFGVLASGGTALKKRHRRKSGSGSRRAAAPPARPRAVPLATASPPLRIAAAATAVIGVLGVALAALAWSGAVPKPMTSQAPAGRSMTFSYTTSVLRTPAYDGTTVTSPDPVFRNLADSVDVHFAYRGAPGTVAVAVELSTASGWHSSVPLAGPTRFDTSRYDGTVRLDLKSLEARAQAAAAVIGLPAEPVTIAVVPTVSTAQGARFAPTLPMTLSPLLLTLTGGVKVLVVEETPAVPEASTASRTIGALGRRISVATGRIVSAILLVGWVLVVAVLVLIARRSAPKSEGAGIRRRYCALLVPVHPMPTPPGRPVVDVTEFATLVKLAERYGLLVMHWSRSDVETFVVQDDGTTYRYRTGAGD